MDTHKPAYTLLGQRRFLPFFVTQFLGAFNDNLFKNVLILLVTFNTARFTTLSPGVMVNIAAALFILPFVLFSAAAGDIADHMDKARLIQIIKTAEVLIMMLAGAGLALSSLSLLLAALFLMGTHSAFFGPLKYSILPQTLKDHELVGGNAWVEMGTFVAILLGTLAAGYLLARTQHMGVIASCWIGVALAGLLASFWIPATVVPTRTATDLQSTPKPPAISRFGWQATKNIIDLAREKQSVWLSVLAISWFWLVGSVLLAQLPALVKEVIHADANAVTGLLAVFSISVGMGSLLCEKLSGDQVEIGLVPLGSMGISVFAIDLWWTCAASLTATAHDPALGAAMGLAGNPPVTTVVKAVAHIWALPLYRHIAWDLGFLGLFSGLFIVPLYSLMQLRTPKNRTSRVVAANNVMNALFMVVGAGLAAGGLASGLTVPEIILSVGIGNALVAIYIYTLVPEFLWRLVTWIVVHTLYRLESQGIEHVPTEGGALIICNHISFADALMIAACVRRPVRFVMDYKIFNNLLLGWLFKTAKTIPIAPQKVNQNIYDQAFEHVRTALANGELVCIFPEGKISQTGEMNEFKAGIIKIIEQSPATPVVPMALSGLWGSAFSRKHKTLGARLGLKEIFRTVRLNIGPVITDERRYQPTRLHDTVSELRGNWL